MMTTADAVMLEGEQANSPLDLTSLRGTGWWVVISVEMKKPYFINLCSFLKKENAEKKQVYPPNISFFKLGHPVSSTIRRSSGDTWTGSIS